MSDSEKRVFVIRAWLGDDERTKRPDLSEQPDTDAEKREAIRILHRQMRELGEGARGSVRLEGFGYVVQQRLERDETSGRLEFVNEEL